MSLKELTKEAHTNAERQEFVKILFSGSIDPKLYATYLKNQHPQYEILEVCAMPLGLLNGMPDIRRAPAINDDFVELWGADNTDSPQMCPVVQDYVKYILSIKDDPKRLMAHIYVRHMGAVLYMNPEWIVLISQVGSTKYGLVASIVERILM